MWIEKPIHKDATKIMITEKGIDTSRPNSVYITRAIAASTPKMINIHAKTKIISKDFKRNF
jgi:hypothetical protein